MTAPERLLVLVLLVADSPALAADIPSVPASGRLAFTILRNGTAIGAHSARFERDGEALTVRIRVDIAVKIGFLTVYRLTETKRETWRDGKLVAYAHDGNDNGTVERVRARSDGRKLVVSEPQGRPPVPLGTLVSTNWNSATVRSKALLASNAGVLVPVTVVELPRETMDLGRGPEPVSVYAIEGKLSRTLLYDSKGVWVGMRLVARDGSRIEYRRR